VPAIARETRMQVPAGLSRLFVLGLLLGAAIGQNATSAPLPDQVKKSKPPSGTGDRRKSDPEIQAILEGAAAAPAEFGADVMIRLAESSKAANRATKVDLLSKAFDLAAAAGQPVKRAVVPGGMVNMPSALLTRAYRLNMDKLSLQSRVVSDMLPLDAAKARELFEEIQLPALSPVGCEERLTYDLELFYQALAKVVGNGFTAKDKLKGRHIALLAPFVGTLQSHAQARPVAELLVNAHLSPSDLGQLTNAFAGALAQLRGDEGSFAATAMGPGGISVSGAVADLVAALEEKDVSSVGLLRAVRQYLVSNFGDVRCGGMRGQADNNSLPQAVKYFNQQFWRQLQLAQIPAITVDELKGARIVPGAPPIRAYWQSPEGKRLAADMRNLRVGDGEDRVTAAEKASPAWSSKLTEFLTELEAWQPDDEPAVDVFHQKSILYEGLIDLVPTGPVRSQVIDSFVELLEENSAQVPNRMEWFVHADDLLSGKRGADDREEVIQAFLNSGDPTLSLYARLERWEPRPTGTGKSEGAPPWR
jgi:hypothetical protein